MNVILRIHSVKARTGLPRSSLYALIASGHFPKPIHLGARSIGWIEAEVEGWISARIEQSRGKPA
jgi:prophage regulatory protein